MTNHVEDFFAATKAVCEDMPFDTIEKLADELVHLRDRGGRLFLIGVGGSAANCSHAVNDFRKLCGIEAYAPTDNVAEITARTNDQGWGAVFDSWLKGSKIKIDDAVLILSVGGGTSAYSLNIIRAVEYARTMSVKVFGIVGRADGYTATYGDTVVIIPNYYEQWLTPLAESFQSVILHCLVSHPKLQINPTAW